MLKVSGLNVHYGVIHAIKGIDFEVNEGEIVTLIGSNGAGKTTTLQTVSGLIKPSGGNIEFLGESLKGLKANKAVSKGLVQVPEGRRVFPHMSVKENLEMGAFTNKSKADLNEGMEWAYNKFPILGERRKQMAGTLSGGEQQMLAIGRAMMARPKLLLLDEPSMGLAPIIVSEIFNIIREINKEGTTILLVEQNANMALKIAERAYVLENGKVALSGSAAELLVSDRVKKAYLGG